MSVHSRTAKLANKWGGGGQGIQRLARLPVDEDDACDVCKEFGKDVLFGCSHELCIGCVQQIRASTVISAKQSCWWTDCCRVGVQSKAGMECPFCRQVVESLEPLDPSNVAIKEALATANSAAKLAGTKHAPKQAPPPGLAAGAPAREAVVAQTWKCTACRRSNTLKQKECDGCGNPPPADVLGRVQSGPPRHLDFSTMTIDNVMKQLLIRFHPDLNCAFEEAGMPYCIQEGKGVVTGDIEGVIAAAERNGLVKIHKLLKILIAHRRFRDLCSQMVGNYSSQDLLEAAARLRQAGHELRKRNKTELANKVARGAQGSGNDFYHSLISDLVPNSDTLATHRDANFVLQKALATSSAAEAVQLSKAILTKPWQVYSAAPQVLKNQHVACGAHVAKSASKRLRDIVVSEDDTGAEERQAASKLLDTACKDMVECRDQWVPTIHRQDQLLSAMIIYIVEGALRGGHFEHAQMLLKLITDMDAVVNACLGSWQGTWLLSSIVNMEVPADAVSMQQVLIQSVADIAYVLDAGEDAANKGFAGFAMKEKQMPPAEHTMRPYSVRNYALVRSVFERIAQQYLQGGKQAEELMNWLTSIAGNLVQHARGMLYKPDTTRLLVAVVTHPCFSDDEVRAYIKECHKQGAFFVDPLQADILAARPGLNQHDVQPFEHQGPSRAPSGPPYSNGYHHPSPPLYGRHEHHISPMSSDSADSAHFHFNGYPPPARHPANGFAAPQAVGFSRDGVTLPFYQANAICAQGFLYPPPLRSPPPAKAQARSVTHAMSDMVLSPMQLPPHHHQYHTSYGPKPPYLPMALDGHQPSPSMPYSPVLPYPPAYVAPPPGFPPPAGPLPPPRPPPPPHPVAPVGPSPPEGRGGPSFSNPAAPSPPSPSHMAPRAMYQPLFVAPSASPGLQPHGSSGMLPEEAAQVPTGAAVVVAMPPKPGLTTTNSSVSSAAGSQASLRPSIPQVAHQRPAASFAAAAAGAAAWDCKACTYRHEGHEAGFLACAICETQKGND